MPTHNWVRLVFEMFPYDYHIPSQKAGLSPGIVKTVNIWEKWHQVITDCPASLLITFIKVPQSQPTAIKQRCMNKHAATMVESLRYLNVWKPINRIREYIFAYFNSFYIGLLLLLLLVSYRFQGVQQQWSNCDAQESGEDGRLVIFHLHCLLNWRIRRHRPASPH